jgi:hypothetical protein
MSTSDTCCTIVPYFRLSDQNLPKFKAMCEQFVELTQKEEKVLYYGFAFNGRLCRCRRRACPPAKRRGAVTASIGHFRLGTPGDSRPCRGAGQAEGTAGRPGCDLLHSGTWFPEVIRNQKAADENDRGLNTNDFRKPVRSQLHNPPG